MIGQLQVEVGSALQEMVQHSYSMGKYGIVLVSGLMPNTTLFHPQPLFRYTVNFWDS